MDSRTIAADGLTVCPNCARRYAPELGDRNPLVPVQVQFPDAPVVHREQLISGICSDACWRQYAGDPSDPGDAEVTE